MEPLVRLARRSHRLGQLIDMDAPPHVIDDAISLVLEALARVELATDPLQGSSAYPVTRP